MESAKYSVNVKGGVIEAYGNQLRQYKDTYYLTFPKYTITFYELESALDYCKENPNVAP